eukprot:TRINITY_DN11259_c0_g1_i1.p1 TRINITY_DN11259_c0_g1~~TRINITY_DN11259_c0_g1_i1.p1  ORF type:complete len:659 (+),score=237.32 TRINITY_DN11259_c0_g1_i1:80-2056(+)
MAAQILECFKRFDVDGDGIITRSELAKLFQSIDPDHWDNAKIESLMQCADTNSDGNIDYEEFVAWLAGDVEKKKGEVFTALQLRKLRTFDSAVLVKDRRLLAGDSPPFQVTLEQEGGAKLGVKIDNHDTHLVVKQVMKAGLVPEYNAENPDKQLSKGDSIIKINGISNNAVEMMKELLGNSSRKLRELELEVKPGVKSQQFMEKIKDFYNVDRNIIDEDIGYSLRHAVNNTTNEMFSVKSVHKKGAHRVQLEAEIISLKCLDHPHVCRLYEIFEDHHDIHLVMDKCDGGELLERIINEDFKTEAQVATIMQHIFSACHHLQTKQVAHRDLRPENVLLLHKERLERCHAKLTGFGYSKRYEEGDVLKSVVGDVLYRAPETYKEAYDYRCDHWSLGVMMYAMMCGYPPFCADTDRQVASLVRQGALSFPPEDWKDKSKEAVDLLKGLIELDPSRRINLAAALQHPWMTGSAPKAIIKREAVQRTQSRMNIFGGQNIFKKAARRAIAQRLSVEDLKDLRKEFSVLDMNSDCRVTLHELQEALERMGRGGSLEEMRQLMETLDVDGSLSIGLEEFIAAAMDQKAYSEENVLWSAFNVFDADNSGTINKKELAKALMTEDVQAVSQDKNVLQALEDCDRDGDGVINFDEFLAMMRSADDSEEF